MTRRKIQILFGFVLTLLMAMGCGGNPFEKPTPTPTPRPTPYITIAATKAPEVTEAPTATTMPTMTTAPQETLTPTHTPTPTATSTPTPTLTSTPTPTPTNTPTPTPSYTYTDIEDKEFWTTADLNMRSLPSTKGEIIDCAPKKSKVIATAKCNEKNWYRVEYNGKTGYMSMAYLTDEEPQKYLIVIDPGHQRNGNYGKEPNGPGSDVLKAKVSSGTQGVSTRIPEYELTLAVSFYIKEELEARGYEVVMTRETHDIDISNVERALIANELNADAFIRIHANGSENKKTEGVLTVCQTKKNPYNAYLYEESRRLSELVLDEVVEETGATKKNVWETDTMTGINWTTVPTTILEMGYMSNEKEDKLMATEDYRRKIAKGVADAIDRYFEE